jgi:hypothetical protein
MATPDDVARGTVLLPLGGEPDPKDPDKIIPRMIVLRQPTEGQLLVLSRLPKAIEQGRIGEALFQFGDILERLIVQDDDRQYAYNGLANEEIEANEYLDLMVKIFDHFQKQAPATGPAPRKRAASSTRPRTRR